MKKSNVGTVLCILSIFLWYPHIAWAGEVLSLGEAIRIALDRNPDILSVRQEQVKAGGALDTAKGAFLPSLSAGGDYTMEEKTSSTSDEDSYGANVKISETLYAGGKLRAYRREALTGIAIADAAVAESEENVIYDLYGRYYDVLLGVENVRTAEDALTYAKNYFAETQKRYEVGLATNLEVTRAEKLLVTSRKDLVSVRNALASYKIRFFELLNIRDGLYSSVDGVLRYRLFTGNADISLRRAMDQRPELISAREKIKLQEQEILIAKSELRPTIGLSASWEYDDNPSGTDDKDQWKTSLNVDFPLFDSGITRGYIVQERATLEQAIQNVVGLEEQVKSEVKRAYLDIDTAAHAVDEAGKNLELAKESLRLAEVGYREGVGIQLDVLDARAELTDARTLYSKAVKDHELAWVGILKAEGRLVKYSLDKDRQEEVR